MSLDCIRHHYGVPAKKGGRVRYTNGRVREGTITGARGAHLTIRMDGDSFAQPYHPTWDLQYLQPAGTEA